MVTVAVLFLPWIPVFFRQAVGRVGSRAPLIEFLLDSSRWLAFGETITPEIAKWPMLALFMLLGLFVLSRLVGELRTRQDAFVAVVLTLALILPVISMWFIGTTDPAFFKFMIVAVVPLALIISLAIWWTRNYPIGALFSLMLVVLILWSAGLSLTNMYIDPVFARADYRGIAAQINEEDHPNAGVVLNAANQWEVFTYYHREEVPGAAQVYPVPKGYPDPTRIDRELAEIIALHDRIYAIFWGDAERDPERLVERWLDSHAFKARDEWVGDVRFVTYSVSPEEPEMVYRDNLIFENGIRLIGHSLSEEEVAAGDILQLTLFWSPSKNLDQRYKVFLHFLDEEGEIVAQRDSEPGGGLALTTTWQPGETVVDNHGLVLPDDLNSGIYSLYVGLYLLTDPAARLSIDKGGDWIDSYPLAAISVTDK